MTENYKDNNKENTISNNPQLNLTTNQEISLNENEQLEKTKEISQSISNLKSSETNPDKITAEINIPDKKQNEIENQTTATSIADLFGNSSITAQNRLSNNQTIDASTVINIFNTSSSSTQTSQLGIQLPTTTGLNLFGIHTPGQSVIDPFNTTSSSSNNNLSGIQQLSSTNIIQKLSNPKNAQTGIDLFGGLQGEQQINIFGVPLNETTKEILNIFESIILIEEEKQIKINEIFEELKAKSYFELLQIFNAGIFLTIQNNIRNCNTEAEIALVNIIQLAVEQAMKIPQKNVFGNQNPIFNDIRKSGLFDKIISLIKQKTELETKENNNHPFPDVVVQLVQIYIQMMKGQQIEEEMIDQCSYVLDISSTNILGSNALSEQEKYSKAISLYQKVKKMNLQQKEQIFTFQELIIIRKRMGNCSSAYQKMILNIIEVISINFEDQYLILLKHSGLIENIQNVIKLKVQEEEEKDSSYSDVIEQLMRIYINVTKNQQVDAEMIDICARVLDYRMSELVNKIRNFGNDEQEKNDQTIKFNEMLKYLVTSGQTIQSIVLFRGNDYKIPEQFDKLIKERIAPLMHINCSSSLLCPFKISVGRVSIFQDFKGSILRTLSYYSKSNNNFKEFLLNKHDALFHINSLIILLTDSNYIQQETEEIEQLQEQHKRPSLFVISQALDLLHQLLSQNSTNCITATNVPNLINSLIILSKFKVGQHLNQNEDKHSEMIRFFCFHSLNTIQIFGDEMALMLFSQLGFVNTMISIFSTGGGSHEEKDNDIFFTLSSICNFFIQFHRIQRNDQRNLIKTSEEQLEEDGGNEEIEIQLINKGNILAGSIQQQAKSSKRQILNFYLDLSNIFGYIMP